jgi:hypothetical protein
VSSPLGLLADQPRDFDAVAAGRVCRDWDGPRFVARRQNAVENALVAADFTLSKACRSLREYGQPAVLADGVQPRSLALQLLPDPSSKVWPRSIHRASHCRASNLNTPEMRTGRESFLDSDWGRRPCA